MITLAMVIVMDIATVMSLAITSTAKSVSVIHSNNQIPIMKMKMTIITKVIVITTIISTVIEIV